MGYLEDLLGQQEQDPMASVGAPADLSAPPPMDPVLKNYFVKKGSIPALPAAPAQASAPSAFDQFKSKYSDDELKKVQGEAQGQKSGLGMAQFAAGLGDALAGRSNAATNENFNQIRKGIDDRTVGAFEKQRGSALQDIAAKKSFEGSDPNSEKSKVVQGVIQKLWGHVLTPEQIAKVTADDADLVYKPMELKSKLDQQSSDRNFKNELLKGSKDKKDADRIDKLVKDFKADLDADKGRAGNFGQLSSKVQTAERLQTLTDAFKGGNLPPSQVEEFALGLSNMLAPGGGGSRAQVEALVPHSAVGDAQKLKSWLFNEPLGANQQKFVQMMNHTVQREKQTAMNQLNSIRASRLPAHKALKQADPEAYNALLQSYGLDEKNIKDGRYVPQDLKESTVLMKDPNGNIREIPAEQAEAAKEAGGQPI